MKLPDRSPGLTIVAAAVFVYGTILVEIGMWTVATWTAMFATLALVIVLAIVVCRWLFSILDEEETPVAVAPAAVAPAVEAPQPQPAKRPARRPTALPA